MIPENALSEQIIGACIEVHRYLGPGLLEAVYEEALCHELGLCGLPYLRQQPVPVVYKGTSLSTDLRLDLLVDNLIIVDVKAKDQMTPVDHAKTLTYLRLTGMRLGLNINFHEPVLVKGVKRIVNNLR